MTITLVPANMTTGVGNMTNTGSSVANQIPKYSDTSGTAIAPGYTVGTAASNLVQLDGSAKLPAVDGSLLTNVGGGFTLLSTQTASASSSIDFTTGIDGTYYSYFFTLQDMRGSGQLLWVRVSTDGGATWKSGASDYKSYTDGAGYSAIRCGHVTLPSSGRQSSATAIIDPTSTTKHKLIANCISGPGCSWYINDDDSVNWNGSSYIGSYVGSTAAINGIRFIPETGTITSGTFKMYGVK